MEIKTSLTKKSHLVKKKQMSSIIGLVVEAETIGRMTGQMKKDWVLDQLTDMDKNQASLLIDDIVAVLNCPQTVKLFRDSSYVCVKWCCRKYQ